MHKRVQFLWCFLECNSLRMVRAKFNISSEDLIFPIHKEKYLCLLRTWILLLWMFTHQNMNYPILEEKMKTTKCNWINNDCMSKSLQLISILKPFDYININFYLNIITLIRFFFISDIFFKLYSMHLCINYYFHIQWHFASY